jgi:hypothetical protein
MNFFAPGKILNRHLHHFKPPDLEHPPFFSKSPKSKALLPNVNRILYCTEGKFICLLGCLKQGVLR